jgi:3-hydroxybutyryl-CoA dehydratase
MPSWTYDTLQVGTKASVKKTVTDQDLRDFARVSLDDNPVHLDEKYAEGTMFKKRIAHGMLGAGLISAVLGTQMPGHGTIYLSQTLKFKKPVFLGETVTAYAEVAEKGEKKRVRLKTWVENEKGEVVTEGEAMTMLTQ